MKISVLVKPRTRKNKIEKLSENFYKVDTVAPALDDKANLSVLKLLAEYFKVPKSAVRLVMGKKYKEKVFEILK